MTGLPAETAADRETAGELLRRAIAASPLGRARGIVRSAAVPEVLLAGAIALAVILAGLPALHAYQVPGAVALLAVAGGASVAVAFLAARVARLAAPLSYIASLVGLLVLLLAADGPHPGAVASALVGGPNRLLTETLPLSGSRSELTALVVLVWVCGAATAESLVRSRSRRGRAPFALAIPPGLYVLCFAVSSGAPHRDRLAAPALLVVVAFAAALRSQLPAVGETPTPVIGDEQSRPPSTGRLAVTGLVVAAAVAVATTAVATSIPSLGARPAALHRRPPTVVPVITDPVDTLAQLRDGRPHAAPVTDLDVRLSGPSTGYLAVAELDAYDGDQWQFGATFQPTGGRVPPAPTGPTIATVPVRQQIRVVGALPVPLLPALDRPVSVTGIDVVTDALTGMLLPQSSTAAKSFQVLSVVPETTLAGLSPADGLASDAGVAADRQLPPDTSAYMATAVRFLGSLAGGVRPSASVAFLQQVVQALHTRERWLDPNATVLPSAAPPKPTGRPRKGVPRTTTTTTTIPPSGYGGTSLSAVINAVTVTRSATPEQFATLFALVARYLGVPARVVTGFRLAPGSGGQALAAGSYRVTNRQAWAWVEIPVAGLGWVVCDPTPDAAEVVAAPPPESASAPSTTLPPRQANAVPRSQIVGGHALARPARIRTPRSHGVVWWVWVLVGLGACLLLAAVAGPGQAAARRTWRRRMRRAADPGLLAIGAWLELIDGLERAAVRVEPGATSSEVAAEVGHHFGAELVSAATTVGIVADRAVFSTTAVVGSDEAAAAWSAQRELRRRIMSGLDTRQRMRSTLTVGSAPRRPSGRGRV